MRLFEVLLRRSWRRDFDRNYFPLGLEEIYVDAVVGQCQCEVAISHIKKASEVLVDAPEPLFRPQLLPREQKRLAKQGQQLQELRAALAATEEEALRALYRSARRSGFEGGYSAWRDSDVATQLVERAARTAASHT